MTSTVGKGGSSSEIWLACENCTFTTRNSTLMDRHKTRCIDSPVMSHAGKIVPSHHFHRNYTCDECGYSTTKSKMFLYHKVDVHHEDLNIYPCDQCDYASKYKCKVIRHQQNIHNRASTMSELMPLELPKREEDADTLSDADSKFKKKTPNSAGSGKKSSAKRPAAQSYSVGPNKKALEANMNGDTPVAGSSSRLKYVEDLSENDENTMFKCKFCLYTNRFKWMVAKHLSNTHLKSKIYRCTECSFSTLKKNDYCVHRAVHSNQTVYVCDECLYRTTMKNNLERHKQNHRTDGPVKCSLCSYSSTNDGAIQRHIQEHHPNDSDNHALEQMLIAEIEAQRKENDSPAEKSSDQDEPLNLSIPKSLLDDDDEEDKPLDLSMKSSPDGPENDEDYNEQSSLQCTHCSYIAKWPSDLRRHMMVHTGERRFKCQFCFKSYKYRFDLNIHIRRTHRSQYNKGASSLPRQEKGKEKSVAAKSKSQSAAGGKAGTAGEFPCRFCPYLGKYASETERHERLHTGEKPYHCLFCEYNSFWKGDMKRHLQKHHETQVSTDELLHTLLEQTYQPGGTPAKCKKEIPDEEEEVEDDVEELDQEDENDGESNIMKNYSTPPDGATGGRAGKQRCHMCPYTTLSPAKLRCHIAIHENLKLYKCPHCGKRSNWNWDIRKHIKANHPNAEVDVIILTESEARATIKEYLSKQRYGPKSPRKIPPALPPPKPKVPPVTLKIPHLPHVPSVTAERGMSKTAKALSRCRPFKCSGCGQRSNWKWDLLKHIREKHTNAKLIVLSEEEARATWPEPVLAPKKNEKKTQDPASNMAALTGDPPLTANGKDQTDCKRFKCSSCMYRSNWRSDIVRHIRKKHKYNAKLEIMKHREAYLTLWEYNRLFGGKRRKYELPQGYKAPPGMYLKPTRSENDVDDAPATGDSSPSSQSQPTKMWKCSKCEFRNADRSVVVKHLVSHSSKEENATRPAKIRHRSDSTEESGTFPGKKFTCKVCHMESIWRSAMYRHIRDVHKRNDYHKVTFLVDKEPTSPPATTSEVEELNTSQESQSNDSPQKRNKCPYCPYKTCKRSMLTMHMSYHKPQPGNKFKCSYCPYYVCARRLLHQHMRLHLMNPYTMNKVKLKSEIKTEVVRNVVSSPEKSTVSRGQHIGGRYPCEKCPYVAKARNDLLYHKQFHRPRAGVPFSCEKCGYWATHRRILMQHEKVHTPEYGMANSLSGSPGKKMPTSQMILASPAKSDVSEYYMTFDTMEASTLKQALIASKVTNAKIKPDSLQAVQITVDADGNRVLASPPKSSDPDILSSYVVNKSGHILSNGSFRKLHRCRRCPYTNVRLANVRQHEAMHGLKGKEGRELLKCQFCDYYCGNKGLLSHHLKVHSKQYEPGKDSILDVEIVQDEGAMEVADAENKDLIASNILSPNQIKSLMENDDQPSNLPANTGFFIRYDEKSGDHILEQIRYKKWCCEKCPYATMKQKQFERHLQLHGSKQKYICEYCDYSVPGYNLLLQHNRLHLLPNPNLLAVQSVSNLQHLPEVAADVAAATKFPPKMANGDNGNEALGIHDHLELYENTASYMEPKKLYKCDRCPYNNVRRDHLLAHLKFHMIKGPLECPYCDYSVSKHHLLTQHIKVHFSTTNMEINNTSLDDSASVESSNSQSQDKQSESADTAELPKLSSDDKENVDEKVEGNSNGDVEMADAEDSKKETEEEKQADEEKEPMMEESADTVWICQYCDRAFKASDQLLRHEMQHLMGNRFNTASV